MQEDLKTIRNNSQQFEIEYNGNNYVVENGLNSFWRKVSNYILEVAPSMGYDVVDVPEEIEIQP